jgi:hypothetical protein
MPISGARYALFITYPAVIFLKPTSTQNSKWEIVTGFKKKKKTASSGFKITFRSPYFSEPVSSPKKPF